MEVFAGNVDERKMVEHDVRGRLRPRDEFGGQAVHDRTSGVARGTGQPGWTCGAVGRIDSCATKGSWRAGTAGRAGAAHRGRLRVDDVHMRGVLVAGEGGMQRMEAKGEVRRWDRAGGGQGMGYSGARGVLVGERASRVTCWSAPVAGRNQATRSRGQAVSVRLVGKEGNYATRRLLHHLSVPRISTVVNEIGRR